MAHKYLPRVSLKQDTVLNTEDVICHNDIFYDTRHDVIFERRVINSVQPRVQHNDDSSGSESDNEPSPEELLSEISLSLRNEHRAEILNQLKEIKKPVEPDIDIFKKFESAIDRDDVDTKCKHFDNVPCASCSITRRIENAFLFQKGQHIRMPGKSSTYRFNKTLFRVYSHHAIIKEVLNTNRDKAELILIHFIEKRDNYEICETRETIDLKKDEIDVIEYMRPRYKPDEIVRRAESMLPKDGEKEGRFGKYELFGKNCEHFATWCVVDEGQSFQVDNSFASIGKWLSHVTGTGSHVANYFRRVMAESADEIATGFFSGVIGPGLCLGAVSVAYLIYCIYRTIACSSSKNKTLCECCFKREMIKLWFRFGAFLTFNGLSFILVHFALPLVTSCSAPILPIVVCLSLGLQWSFSQMIDYFYSQFAFEKIPIQKIKDIVVGDILEINYFKLPHAVIVTQVPSNPDNETKGQIKCVHYGIKDRSLFGKREVIEEYMTVDTVNEKVVKLNECQLKAYMPREVVLRARMRVGEAKWNPLNNYSSEELASFAKIREEHTEVKVDQSKHKVPGKSSSKQKSSFFVREIPVHLRSILEPGDIIKLNGRYCLVLSLKTNRRNSERRFKMEVLIFISFKASTLSMAIDLNNDTLSIMKYLDAHCYPKSERIRRALQRVGEWGFLWEYRFFESIIKL